MEQDMHTYRGDAGTSRIDRVYCILHPGWQHTRQCFCDPLPTYARGQSMRYYHLPIQFGIFTPKPKENRADTIPRWVTERKEWKEKTWRIMGYALGEEGELIKLPEVERSCQDGEGQEKVQEDALGKLRR